MASLPIKDRIQQELLIKSPLSARELCQRCGVSQPVLSRQLDQMRTQVGRVGEARRTQYFRRRKVAGVDRFPLYSVSEQGQVHLVADVHPAGQRGFYVQAAASVGGGEKKGIVTAFQSRFYDDLPYFFEDMRPAGYLGRLVPQHHPDLEVPGDVQNWTGDHAVVYFSRYGWDLPGNLILGDRALALFHEQQARLAKECQEWQRSSAKRASAFVKAVESLMHGGIAGSTAGGEQPKILSGIYLEKFFGRESQNERARDLLICESVAHDVMRQFGQTAPSSQILEKGSYLFLQIERFDRVLVGGARSPRIGRRGVLSLQALDLEMVGSPLDSPHHWIESTMKLIELKKVADSVLNDVIWRQTFGECIGNSDMHLGNLAFFVDGETVGDLTPCYDMLPMQYAPWIGPLGHLGARPDRPLIPKIPARGSREILRAAQAAAADFWQAVTADKRVSKGFRKIAAQNVKVVRTFYF